MADAPVFERITYREEGSRTSVTIYGKVEAEGGGLLLVTPLDKEGEDLSYYDEIDGVKTLVEVQQILDLKLIRKRTPVRMSPTYGTFEEIQ